MSALAVEKLRNEFGRKHLVILPYSPKATEVVATIITFHFVCFGWIFFRCDSFADSWIMLKQIGTNFHFNLFKTLFQGYKAVFILLSIGFILHSISAKKEEGFKQMLIKIPLPLKILYFFICIYIAIQFKQSDVIKPIYLQF